MPALASASGNYQYDQVFMGHKLSDLVAICHKELSRQSAWFYLPLIPGQFGYDNIIESLGHALTNFKNTDIETLASFIHDGWANNYIYWRDNQPFITNSFYKAPGKPLGDTRRDQYAATKFNDLDEDEKEKDRIIAKTLYQVIKPSASAEFDIHRIK
jgi:hypothetical protein